MHLGIKAFEYLQKNTLAYKKFPKISEEKWRTWEQSFRIACLLHDCGHAPFSHTFEKYYKRHNSLEVTLATLCGHPDQAALLSSAAPHEKMSAILVMTHYKDRIDKLVPTADIELIVRMITGWRYPTRDTDERKIEGCLIELLNGTAIDVDKLDYIMRDTWASGFVNASIDIDRLFASITLENSQGGNLVIAYAKPALNVLSSVLLARNYLYQWVYYHHKVLYDQWLLLQAVETVPRSLYDMDNESFEKLMFSIDIFSTPQKIGEESFWMPCDGDLIHLIKRSAKSKVGNEYADEWLSRGHKRKSMWKSFAEYCIIFEDLPLDHMESLDNEKLQGVVKTALDALDLDENAAMILPSKPKLAQFTADNVFIKLQNKTIPFSKLPEIGNNSQNNVPAFFYLYFDRDIISKKALIEQIFTEYSKT